MHRAVHREEGRARLRALGWSFRETLNHEVEVWERAGAEIRVTPEADGSGDYAEQMIAFIEAEG